ncbi:MAG TPA: hypothetical protein VGP03_10570, partial [Pseudonocardiaceae bacterium]|nr:hypothetical protein [Pseudonocardiaceae bacterium]
VFDAERIAVAALAVVKRTGRDDLRTLAPAVRTAAISVSRALQERSPGRPALPSNGSRVPSGR